jgi:hypothetical protein
VKSILKKSHRAALQATLSTQNRRLCRTLIIQRNGVRLRGLATITEAVFKHQKQAQANFGRKMPQLFGRLTQNFSTNAKEVCKKERRKPSYNTVVCFVSAKVTNDSAAFGLDSQLHFLPFAAAEKTLPASPPPPSGSCLHKNPII